MKSLNAEKQISLSCMSKHIDLNYESKVWAKACENVNGIYGPQD